MDFPLLFLFQCWSAHQHWSIGGGFLSLQEVANAPLISAYYLVEVNDRFFIRGSMEYWQKEHREIEGTRSKDCIFSSLSFTETGFLRFKIWKMELGVGPGIGLHLLKNRVKERNEYGSWVITDYYCLNSNPIDFHIEEAVSFKFARFSLSTGVRVGVLFLSPSEENLFYTRGNLREVIYSASVSF